MVRSWQGPLLSLMFSSYNHAIWKLSYAGWQISSMGNLLSLIKAIHADICFQKCRTFDDSEHHEQIAFIKPFSKSSSNEHCLASTLHQNITKTLIDRQVWRTCGIVSKYSSITCSDQAHLSTGATPTRVRCQTGRITDL